MRKAILYAVVGLFVSSGAAWAEGECSWGAAKSASAGGQSQSVVTDTTTSAPTTTTAKETKG